MGLSPYLAGATWAADWRRRSTMGPCASHLPVLRLCATLFQIRHVIEFGLGEFSTRAFLDRLCFPHLDRLVSYEDDPVWADRAAAPLGRDPRWDVRVHAHKDRELAAARFVADVSANRTAEGADLALVDNGIRGDCRRRVSDALRGGAGFAGVALLHDANDKRNGPIAATWPHRLLLRPVPRAPATAVLSLDPTKVDAVRHAAVGAWATAVWDVL